LNRFLTVIGPPFRSQKVEQPWYNSKARLQLKVKEWYFFNPAFKNTAV